MPTLYIDSGSSLVKWGLCSDIHSWVEKGSCKAENIGALAHAAGQASAAVVADVAGAERRTRIRRALGGIGVCMLQSAAEALGVRNLYEDPRTLGIDRWCAAVAAYGRLGSCIVVAAGTAVTFNWIDGDGRFRGGAILPGERLMRHALAGATCLEADIAGAGCEAPAVRTADAVAAGVRLAVAGALRMFERDCAIAEGSVPVVVCGGDSAVVAAWISGAVCEPDLVLEGMRLLAPPAGG